MTKLSNTQAAKMRAQLEAHDKAEAEAVRATEVEFIQPLSDIVSSDKWADFEAKLTSVKAQYLDDHFVFPHINAILTAMRNLPLEVARRTKG